MGREWWWVGERSKWWSLSVYCTSGEMLAHHPRVLLYSPDTQPFPSWFSGV